ncbi:hypothetical protein VTN02DRAFT_747 [Thermoascus thermophilus]
MELEVVGSLVWHPQPSFGAASSSRVRAELAGSGSSSAPSACIVDSGRQRWSEPEDAAGAGTTAGVRSTVPTVPGTAPGTLRAARRTRPFRPRERLRTTFVALQQASSSSPFLPCCAVRPVSRRTPTVTPTLSRSRSHAQSTSGSRCPLSPPRPPRSRNTKLALAIRSIRRGERLPAPPFVSPPSLILSPSLFPPPSSTFPACPSREAARQALLATPDLSTSPEQPERPKTLLRAAYDPDPSLP